MSHNVKTATTEEGLSYYFEYDGYGNNTLVSITSNGQTISSTAEYTDNGDLLEFTEDALGNQTTYGYDEQTGLLDWVQYPEDTAATRTEYTYDNMYRTATVAATTDTALNLSANYTYEDDLLKTIQTPSTTYTFEYGDFSLRSAVKIGNRNLASYTYESGTNRLQRLDYGNGDRVEYTYDSLGRLILETYEDSETVSYAYDNSGNLATVTDSETGIVTTYYYDLLNRQSGYREQGADLDHTVKYEYDEDNNIASMTEVINGVTKTYSYTYDDDNRIISETVDGITVEYTYDGFGRLEKRDVKQGETVIQTSTPTYSAGSTENSTTGQISSYNGYTYTYDDNGNILTISDGTNTTSYVYDSANQLIRENNQEQGFTHTWTYDNAGNILSRTEYAYTTVEDLDSVPMSEPFPYGYTNEEWGDLLTSYDGDGITYDAIGNPLSDSNWSYAWQHGRQLVCMSSCTVIWTYTYGADGLRTKRTDGTNSYTYIYNGSKLTAMTKGTDTLYFTYDASGTPLAVVYNGTTYYYSTNLQGDILGIKDSSGNTVVTYAYDAWGKILSTAGTMADSLGAVNPLRYRGYVYDSETELYYLQSRYYNPQWGRFINGDSRLNRSLGFLGLNQFAYCLNSPVNKVDSAGKKPGDLFDTVDEAARDAALYIGEMSFENGWEYAVSIYAKATYVIKTVIYEIHFPFGLKITLPIPIVRKKIQYSYTEAVTDQNAWRVHIPNTPNSTELIAVVHTHPMESGQGITRFSDYVDSNGKRGGDKAVAIQNNFIIYVYGPNGEMRRFNPTTNEDIPLYGDLPKSAKKPWQN